MFWVISVYFNIRNTIPKFCPFLLEHPVYMTKKNIGLKVKHPSVLLGFDETWIFSTHFRKNTQMSNSMKIRSVAAELFHAAGRRDGKTERDMKKLTGAFRNFANAT